MRTGAVLALAGLIAIGSACASRRPVTPRVAAPRFPEFVQPPVPPALAALDAAITYERGWKFFQTGDLKNADRDFSATLKAAAAFYPAEAASGYLELARKDPKAALPHFDRALELGPQYLSALMGKGQALAALNRDLDAIVAFEAALAVDPSLVDLRRRVDVLRFRSVEKELAAARQAARSGKLEDAVRAYLAAIASSPESAFLYRELAAVERQKGDADLALAHLQQATNMDPTDAGSFAQIGELLELRGDAAGALAAYASALALEPNAAVEARRDAALAAAALARLPEEYRAIDAAPQLTRAQLAALIGIRLAPLLQTARARDAAVMTDIRSNWAEPWILPVIRAGVMDAYDNHTFQPRAIVRRVDLAQAASRLLSRIAAVAPAQARTWANARIRFSDISAGHLAYPAASVAVAAGVMTTDQDAAFQPSRMVTGAEAIDAIVRLEQLANPQARRENPRR